MNTEEKSILLGQYNAMHEKMAKNIAQRLPGVPEEAQIRAVNYATAQAFKSDILASTDALTEVKTRRVFDATLAAELERSNRTGSALGIAVGDLRSLKKINDEGHIEGDTVLHAVGGAMRDAHLRATDAICRTGGDEFSIILPELDHHAKPDSTITAKDGLVSATLRVLSAIHGIESKHHPHMDFGLTIAAPGDTTESIYARADLASTIAKKTLPPGSACVVVGTLTENGYTAFEYAQNNHGIVSYEQISQSVVDSIQYAKK